MNYGFVIDTRSCIGCHACSTACKSENQVPLGVNRTWVKYTETGRFPDARRTFQVTRCNHCANPPCVRICPVTAMYQRNDGIVEFDSDVCIGCKACMQACPYDAIYVDPDTGTAAKCHYCGHRVENGVEPACVVVCPTHSIIAGDMDDPDSEISRVLGRNDVTVRKPEQGTSPKLFYIGGHDVAQHPTALPREPRGGMWADVLDAHGHPTGPDAGYADAARYEVRLRIDDEGASLGMVAHQAATIRAPGVQGVPGGGPIQIAPGRMANQVIQQVAYTPWHKVPWHWQVPAYLVTKSVGTGAFLVLACLVLGVGWGSVSPVAQLALGAIGIVATLVTTALLVLDLERPERFLRILTRPQWKSWLARGAFLLVGFSAVSTLWWLVDLVAWFELFPIPGALGTALVVATIPLAVGAAVYTAFLFAQCEGRDLWQSPLLPVHLLVHAAIGGGAAAAVTAAVFSGNPTLHEAARWILVGGLAIDLFAVLFGELGVAHASEAAAKAAHAISHGKYARQLWGGAVVLGHVIPLALLAVGAAPLTALAGVLAVAGMYLYEHAFVMAPQELPNS